MGYTHYWRREIEIPKTLFEQSIKDFDKTLPLYKVLDIKLCGGNGKGEPEINNNEVYFNGCYHCGHDKVDLGITWPSKKPKNGIAVNAQSAIEGQWFAGMTLKQRTCNGDCSHETFGFPRVATHSNPCHLPVETRELDEKKRFFNFCKTAFKPYDLPVTVFLVIAKHYLKDRIAVSSDGELENWKDAMSICEECFGYGKDFKLDVD